MGHKNHVSIFIFVLMYIAATVTYSQVTQAGKPSDTAGTAGAPPMLNASDVVGYNNGFFIKSNKSLFQLTINGMTKTRFNLQGDEFIETTEGGAPTAERTYHSSFSVPFARLMFSGHVFNKQLKYTLFYDFSKNKMIYAFTAWHFIPQKMVLRAGMFKRPFARAFLASSVKRQFIDTPLGLFGNGIDTGIELGNSYCKVKGLEWGIGVFNGSLGTSGDFSPNITARLGYNNGVNGYDETDFDGGDFRYGFGINAATEFDHDNNESTVHYAGADAIIKAHGLSAGGAIYLGGDAGKNMFDTLRMRRVGGHVQAGYLIEKRVEPIMRYGFSHARHVKDDVQHAFTGGITLHFIPGHRLKWENNITVHSTPIVSGEPQDALIDMLFVSQLQLYF